MILCYILVIRCEHMSDFMKHSPPWESIVAELVSKFHALYAAQRFIAMFASPAISEPFASNI
jgi:hypothetical protein